MHLGSPPSKAVKAESCDVYHVFLHTGCKLPQADVIRKWHDGVIKITINPGANDKFDDPFTVGESQVLVINDKFAVDTQGTADAEFWVQQEERVGEPKILKIEMDGDCFKNHAIYIREVALLWNNETYRFPIHNYLNPYTPLCGAKDASATKKGYAPYFIVRAGNGTLKHRETEAFILKARDDDHKYIRSMVQWEDPGKVVPKNTHNHIVVKNYKDLPRFLQFRHATKDAFYGTKKASVEGIIFPIAKTLLGSFLCCAATPPVDRHEFTSFDNYAECFTEMGEKVGWKKTDIRDGLKVGEIFTKDHEFGRQIIQGPNSVKLRRVKLNEISDTWKEAIDKDMLPKYAIDGEDLQAVIKDGRLFEIVNSITLEGVDHGGDKSKIITGAKEIWYVVQADCLLFHSKKRPEEQSFVPVLIRLENKNDKQPQTFWHPPVEGTRKTDPTCLSWLLAKMYFRCADWQVYSLGTHFARSHAQNEVFAMSMYRNLPSAHPLFRLLQPHFQGIIGINAQAREVLINPDNNAFASFMSAGDHLDKLLQNCCKELDYKSMVISTDFKTRGLLDLPNFFFRDDAKDLWKILLDYTKEMIDDPIYPSDDDVAKDEELQKFVEEIVDPGLIGFGGAGFPKSLSTKEKLNEYLTVLIFNVSCFHTGVNFQINKYLAYIPNAPPCLKMPPPTQDEVVTAERIMKSLPQKGVALVTMAITEVLGNFSPIERFYAQTKAANKKGYMGENMAVSMYQEACIMRMVKKMEGLTEKIKERNVGKFIAYDVLSPDNIPITTEI